MNEEVETTVGEETEPHETVEEPEEMNGDPESEPADAEPEEESDSESEGEPGDE